MSPWLKIAFIKLFSQNIFVQSFKSKRNFRNCLVSYREKLHYAYVTYLYVAYNIYILLFFVTIIQLLLLLFFFVKWVNFCKGLF